MSEVLIRIWRGFVRLLVTGAALGVLLGLGGRWSPVLDTIGFFRIHFAILAIAGAVLALTILHWRLVWVGAGAAVVAVATLGPVWRDMQRPAPGGGETRAITVMTANVLGGRNPLLHLTTSALLAADADVLAVVEAPAAWSRPTATLARHYPFSSAEPGARQGVILFSKFPLDRIEAARADRNTPAFATARVRIGRGITLGVTAVHLSWPLVAGNTQQRQIDVLGSLLPAGPGPKVLMGDFNAVPWSAAMASAEANTGLSMPGGLRRTWRGGYPDPLHYIRTGSLYGNDIPAVLGHHIDHVLVSPEVGTDAVEVIPLPGSDHDAVWFRLRVPTRVTGNLFALGR